LKGKPTKANQDTVFLNNPPLHNLLDRDISQSIRVWKALGQFKQSNILADFLTGIMPGLFPMQSHLVSLCFSTYNVQYTHKNERTFIIYNVCRSQLFRCLSWMWMPFPLHWIRQINWFSVNGWTWKECGLQPLIFMCGVI